MGAVNAKIILQNRSNRNIRVFISDTVLERDAFIVADKVPVPGDVAADEQEPPPEAGPPKFRFRKDVSCVRVLPDQSQELPWKVNQFLTAFVEDVDEEDVFSKQIIPSLAVPSPVIVFLYDV